jgi:DNA-binding response OmpR family regulator
MKDAAGPPTAGHRDRANRLLIVDDDAAILPPMARFFTLRGLVVETASSPEVAEALLQHRTYDCVILDLVLTRFGGADGLEVLESLRRAHPSTPVVVLSAFISAGVERAARALGADCVLRKPQPLPVLADIVLALIGNHAAGAAKALQ